MKREQKTVFISYRRTNSGFALAIYNHLRDSGYDVFFDYRSMPPGDFEQTILEQIELRAHFVILLTPSALERCHEPGDWLRREIERAIDTRRNIIPLMLDGFNWKLQEEYLTGKLALLKNYHSLNVPVDYFDEAMTRLKNDYLSVPLEDVKHPTPAQAERAEAIIRVADAQPAPTESELTAEQWFEQGSRARDKHKQIECYTEAIRLKPDYARAYHSRGYVHFELDNMNAALRDYDESLRLNPNYYLAYHNRGYAYYKLGDFQAAISDYDQSIRLKPDYALAYHNRGYAYHMLGDLQTAIANYDEALRLNPKSVRVYRHRGNAHKDLENLQSAIDDYECYLELGGGLRYIDHAEVEVLIAELRRQLGDS